MARKKIVAYIALRHHTRFIVPIMENLVGKGADVMYVVGQGEDSQEITAIDMGLKYTHVFDYVDDSDMDDVLKNYRIQQDSIGAALKRDFVLAIRGVTIIDRSLWSSAKEYVGFRNLFRQEKPDLCIALHEMNRWGKMFGFWAKKHHLPYLTLQEGLYYGWGFGLVGHVQYSTLDLVWGEMTRKKLCNFEAPTDRAIPVGNTHLAEEIRQLQEGNIRKEKRREYKCDQAVVVLLLISTTPPPLTEMIPFFDLFARRKDIRLFIKWHPVARKPVIDQWIESIPERIRKRVVNQYCSARLLL
ncbi:MAG: hypothetical protein JRJ38_18975 [Deltaproteobacteria bacterium]|nr:hypothetical protein [Deltaproteobacteria bacterium]